MVSCGCADVMLNYSLIHCRQNTGWPVAWKAWRCLEIWVESCLGKVGELTKNPGIVSGKSLWGNTAYSELHIWSKSNTNIQ